MKKISALILSLLGWKINITFPIPPKCVLCIAPHTSNFDLPLGLIAYKSIGQKASFLIKKDWFFFPLNILFKALGGIPVDRSKKTSLTDQIVKIYNERKIFHLAITPEGTRKPNAEWKMGFYYIALKANVPIVIISFDYKLKLINVHDVFNPTGKAEEDIEKIKNYYRNVQAKFPNQFVL